MLIDGIWDVKEAARWLSRLLAGAAGAMGLQRMEMGMAGSRAGRGFCRGHPESEVPDTHPHRVGDRCTDEEVQGRVGAGAGAGIQAGGLLGWRWYFNRQNWGTSPEKRGHRRSEHGSL